MRRIVIPLAALLVLVTSSVALAGAGRRGTEQGGPTGRVAVLDEVLGDLVEDGTITQHQSDTIVAALEEAKAEALAALREARARLDSFWEDGVLTSEEIAELPFADLIMDPDGPLADAMADGQVTKEELGALSKSWSGHLGRPGGWHRGGHADSWHDGSRSMKGFQHRTGGHSV